jgi:hypothetical protein
MDLEAKAKIEKKRGEKESKTIEQKIQADIEARCLMIKAQAGAESAEQIAEALNKEATA